MTVYQIKRIDEISYKECRWGGVPEYEEKSTLLPEVYATRQLAEQAIQKDPWRDCYKIVAKEVITGPECLADVFQDFATQVKELKNKADVIRAQQDGTVKPFYDIIRLLDHILRILYKNFNDD